MSDIITITTPGGTTVTITSSGGVTTTSAIAPRSLVTTPQLEEGAWGLTAKNAPNRQSKVRVTGGNTASETWVLHQDDLNDLSNGFTLEKHSPYPGSLDPKDMAPQGQWSTYQQTQFTFTADPISSLTQPPAGQETVFEIRLKPSNVLAGGLWRRLESPGHWKEWWVMGDAFSGADELEVLPISSPGPSAWKQEMQNKFPLGSWGHVDAAYGAI